MEKETDTSHHHEDEEKKRSWRDKSLKASGYIYLVSDAALFASGMLSKRYREAASGLLYIGAATTLARYGDESQERHLQNLSLSLSEYLDKEGVELPEKGQLSRSMIAKNDTLIHKIEDFLYKHPSQTANAIFAYGGSQLLKSGLSHGSKWDALGGAAVTSGALAGILIPESKVKTEHTGNPITDGINAIREKPLMVAGGLYTLGNVALIKSSIDEYRANPASKSYMFKLMTAAGYIVANSLMAMSSKSTDPGTDEKDLQKIYRGAARIIHHQPQEIQDMTLRHIASFLATQPETNITTLQAEKMLHKAVDRLASDHVIDERYNDVSWQARLKNEPQTKPELKL